MYTPILREVNLKKHKARWARLGGGGVLLGILGRGVPPGSISDPISDQKNEISHTCFQTRPLKYIPVFRPGL